MSRITNKWALLLMLFLAQSALSFAEVKLYIEDFSIARGQTAEVSLLLDNDKAVSDFQVDVILPEGLQYVEGSVDKTSRVGGRSQTVQASDKQGKLVIVMSSGVSNNTIAAGTGAVVTFSVEAENTASEGKKMLSLENIVISDINNASIATAEETQAAVTILGLGNCTFGAAVESLEIGVDEEYQVDITLDNEGIENLTAISGTLTLPAGLEIVPGDDGKFIYTDRTPSPLTFTFPEDGNTFLLSSSDNTVILGTSGILFSFVVKATDALAETSEIKLTDLRLAASTGNSTPAADVTIAVTKKVTPVVPGKITGGEGEVTTDDFTQALDDFMNPDVLNMDSSDPRFDAYDANGDGKIGPGDIMAIFYLSAGLNADGSQKN
jgi:hypothetical protein